LAGLAADMQTLTGFAFGLIMMGGLGLTGLMPLPDAAVLVGCMMLVNAAQVLARGWRDIAWRAFWPVIVASGWSASFIIATTISCVRPRIS